MKLVGGLLIDCWVGLKWLPIQEVFGGGWKVCCMGGCGLLDTGDWPTKLSSSPRSGIIFYHLIYYFKIRKLTKFEAFF